MTAWKCLAVVPLLAGAALWIGTSSAPAQDVHPAWQGMWFRLKLKEKGFEAEQGKWRRDREKVPIHLKLQSYDPGLPELGDEAFYGLIVAPEPDDTQVAAESAFMTLPIVLNVLTTPGNERDVLVFARLEDGGDVDEGDGLRIAFSARLTARLRADGTIRSATFKSLGGFYVEKQDGECWSGSVKLSGKSVDPAKLPFDPDLIKQ